MAKLDRNSITDARQAIESLIAPAHQEVVLKFLAEQILYATALDNSNWNLNLCQTGKLLRFNVGQEYCINIKSSEFLVSCMLDKLPAEIKNSSIKFRTFQHGTELDSSDPPEFLEYLVKVPGSVGCLISDNQVEQLSLLQDSNRTFIDYAMTHTRILSKSKNAHAVGAIAYLTEKTGQLLSNPDYFLESIENNNLHLSNQLRKKSLPELKKLAANIHEKPTKYYHYTVSYDRDAILVECTKRIAEGICQDCKQPAPFNHKSTGEPYLEVHHIKPLSQGGMDELENLVALCPNCHRKRHHG